MTNTTTSRFCVRCGEQGPFRSPKAARCTTCDAQALVERKEWARNYHAARSRAVSRLVKEQHSTFKHYLDEELSKAG